AVRNDHETLFLNLTPKDGASVETSYSFRVVSCENVATFIKELILEPVPGAPEFKFSPGEYLQLEIPAYGTIEFKNFAIQKPYADVWKTQHVFDYKAVNEAPVRRNYSMAGNPAFDKNLRFNVRIATPPRGQDCEAGTGSSFVFQLKPGDTVKAYGPFGDFHIKPGEKEMVYLGGGAGMAPLRSHLSYLFETLKTKRKVSFWYGARSLQEVFYREYFEKLAKDFPNFSFHLALSEPQPGDGWTSLTGFIHEVLKKEHLEHHPDPTAIEYYLCGPPPMMSAARKLLDEFKVPLSQVAYDEF
ncbi:MAG: NADH:ubiquinone reductase (Na(+)-transporting) subunit F, partial [Spirochaetia bacterium]|nr:NADH:ubiquinone reductase (Na(+)-transporting) subunit F [Spirochaetia bacterium]